MKYVLSPSVPILSLTKVLPSKFDGFTDVPEGNRFDQSSPAPSPVALDTSFVTSAPPECEAAVVLA